ncbi:MAG TPA: MotA/TolQ/ExbB proton channel family protein [Desulfobacterales bacterium]|nr:MotA/TolQ/ExbB proton channel family protein [Desulfobacterales bacterium]
MNILGYMQSTLYLIMNALLYPVMGLLIFLFILMLFISGAFVSEFAFRRKRNQDTGQDSEWLAMKLSNDMSHGRFKEAADKIMAYIKKPYTGNQLTRRFLNALSAQIGKGLDNLDIRIENTLQEYEIEVSRLLDKTRVLVRVGPMLGLMGTLIPMGVALLALSQGDLAQMSNCLIIAFGTTVAGLAIGVLAYVISVVRERWYAEDTKDMAYIAELLMRNMETSPKASQKTEKSKNPT